jgi:hypothetical protein
VGLAAISVIIFSKDNNRRDKQPEDKQYIGIVYRAQTYYLAENIRFADTFDRLVLGFITGNTKYETENYVYKIVVADEFKTITTATAKDPALKSYAGAATRYTNSASQSVISSVICETSLPSTTPPQITLPQIIDRAPQCPPDSVKVGEHHLLR